ncbi:MAG: class I SAM-dependent methyltransferase [Actinomycetota bacterium]
MTEARENKRLLSWTGERCVPWADEASVIHEHLHRYLFSRPLVEGKEVLDLGSGEGYGSQILASSARRVAGIELDPLAVEHARLNYRDSNLAFVEGSVLDLRQFEDGSFDAAVCFEVIEHVSDHDRLLAEVSRVLRPGGIFIVSTPDREVYNTELGHVNPYHLKEMDLQEFTTLLSSQFAHSVVWGQRAVSGSVLSRLDSATHRGVDRLPVRRENDRWSVVEPPAAKYLIAVASNDPVPQLPSDSLLFETGSAAGGEASMRERHPWLGEAVLVGRSLIESMRRRAALVMRERNRRREAKADSS